MGADPLDPDLGPKEERRLKKRRLDVLESYLPHKKLRYSVSVETSVEPQLSGLTHVGPNPDILTRWTFVTKT